MLNLNYICTTEQGADGSDQLYSRLVVTSTDANELERFMNLDGVQGKFEASRLANGQSILVNKKLYEGRHTHPGYTLAETLTILLAAAEKNKYKLRVAPQFLVQLNQGFQAKKRQAQQILPIYGYEGEIENLTLQGFSQLIKSLNKQWEHEAGLECLDKVGEFEDADQVERLIRAYQDVPIVNNSQALPVQEPQKKPLSSATVTVNREEEKREENKAPSELAKSLARQFYLISYDVFYAPSEQEINKIAGLVSAFATKEIIDKVQRNDRLASALRRPQAAAELGKRTQILQVFGALLRGSNPLFSADQTVLQKIAKAAVELMLFTPGQIKKLDQRYIDQPSSISQEKVLKLTESILLEAGFINKQLKAQILEPLEIERARLVKKQAAASADKQAGYQARVSAFDTALTHTKAVLQQYDANKDPETCKAALIAGLTTLKDNPAIVKYKRYEQILRGLMNAAVCVLTGVLPGVIKYAVTGSLFFSVEGNSKDTAKDVFAKTQKLKM